ncbi:MAG: hypothetical protein DRJ40_01830 [Thermoprotei archaeon]|nr:MAG: hypothetical protein DRJ40_01830 [Thermoprotei archaeon]
MNYMVLAILIIVMGFILLTIGLLLSIMGRGRARVGGVVFIGPIPIVFGERNLAAIALIIGLVFMLLTLVLMLIHLVP